MRVDGGCCIFLPPLRAVMLREDAPDTRSREIDREDARAGKCGLSSRLPWRPSPFSHHFHTPNDPVGFSCSRKPSPANPVTPGTMEPGASYECIPGTAALPDKWHSVGDAHRGGCTGDHDRSGATVWYRTQYSVPSGVTRAEGACLKMTHLREKTFPVPGPGPAILSGIIPLTLPKQPLSR